MTLRNLITDENIKNRVETSEIDKSVTFQGGERPGEYPLYGGRRIELFVPKTWTVFEEVRGNIYLDGFGTSELRPVFEQDDKLQLHLSAYNPKDKSVEEILFANTPTQFRYDMGISNPVFAFTTNPNSNIDLLRSKTGAFELLSDLKPQGGFRNIRLNNGSRAYQTSDLATGAQFLKELLLQTGVKSYQIKLDEPTAKPTINHFVALADYLTLPKTE